MLSKATVGSNAVSFNGVLNNEFSVNYTHRPINQCLALLLGVRTTTVRIRHERYIASKEGLIYADFSDVQGIGTS